MALGCATSISHEAREAWMRLGSEGNVLMYAMDGVSGLHQEWYQHGVTV